MTIDPRHCHSHHAGAATETESLPDGQQLRATEPDGQQQQANVNEDAIPDRVACSHPNMQSLNLLETFWCITCNTETPFHLPKRCMSKQKQTYMCGCCNSKHTTLFRGFGGWPPKEFKKIPDDMQTQFYNDIKSKNSDQILAYANDFLTRYEDKTETYACNGEFRPLGFWVTQGYDPERIKNNAMDHEKSYDRLGGDTYRVAVKSDSKATTTGTRREQALQGKKRKIDANDFEAFRNAVNGASSNAASSNAAEPAAEPAAKSSSNSSSSSSSTSHKKKKKHKKDKKKKGKKDKKSKRESSEKKRERERKELEKKENEKKKEEAKFDALRQ